MSCNTKIFGDFWRHELFMKGKQEKSEVVSVVGIQLEAVKDTLHWFVLHIYHLRVCQQPIARWNKEVATKIWSLGKPNCEACVNN